MENPDDRRYARRVLIAIGLLLATAAGLALVYATQRVLVWIMIAVFFAIALRPAVDWAERRVARRWLATLLVFFAAFTLLAALTALIIVPLAGEVAQLADRFPQILADAREGRGPLGRPLERLHLREYARTHQGQIRRYTESLGAPTVEVVRGAVTTVVGVVTVAVLAYLMVLEAPRVIDTVLAWVPARHVDRVRRAGHECARTITGYLTGNLLISLICGGLTFAVTAVMGVPYAGVIALLVAVADLIPLVGATLGAVIAAGAGFFHSTRAGIVILVFFVLYQQVENHFLQPLIYSRIVRLNPLTVLVSLLIAAELAGVLGALLAIPVAAMIQIVLRELCDGRRRPLPPADGPEPRATGAP